MIRPFCLLLVASVFVTRSTGQWPFGQNFHSGMNQMVNGMNNMATNMQLMGEQMATQRQGLIDEDIRRSLEGVPFGNGGSVFITANGGLGYAYNSTDGSFIMYSLNSGSPPSGYLYHLTAQGGTTFNNW